jgi:ABC-type bacteriocin/lantibiotic exporter with double-glycine peptidase domain
VGDIDRVSHYVRWTGPGLLLNGGRLLVVVGVMAMYSWKVTGLTLAVVGLVLGLQSLRWRRTRAVVGALRRRELELRSAIVGVVLHARQLRAYEGRRQAQAQAEAAVSDRSRHGVRLARREAGSAVMYELGVGVAMAALIFVGAYLGAHRQATIGQLLALLLALLLAAAPVQAVVLALRDRSGALSRWRWVRRACLRDRPAPEPIRQHV